MMLQTAEDIDNAKKYICTGPAYEFIRDNSLEEQLRFVPLSPQFAKSENECLWKMVLEAKEKGCYFISNYITEKRYGEITCRGEGVAPCSARRME